MPAKIRAGSILIKQGTLLPDSFRFESQQCSNRWRLVKDLDSHKLDRQLGEAGWTFFSMGGEINASVFGFGAEKAMAEAILKVLANVKSEGFNCLEITQVTLKRFLGVSHVTVSACSRHIRPSPWRMDFAKCNRTRLAAV
jgi:hypothetical protein